MFYGTTVKHDLITLNLIMWGNNTNNNIWLYILRVDEMHEILHWRAACWEICSDAAEVSELFSYHTLFQTWAKHTQAH